MEYICKRNCREDLNGFCFKYRENLYNFMSNYNEQSGYIELSEDDKEALQEGVGKNWAENIINWIINGE